MIQVMSALHLDRQESSALGWATLDQKSPLIHEVVAPFVMRPRGRATAAKMAAFLVSPAFGAAGGRLLSQEVIQILAKSFRSKQNDIKCVVI